MKIEKFKDDFIEVYICTACRGSGLLYKYMPLDNYPSSITEQIECHLCKGEGIRIHDKES